MILALCVLAVAAMVALSLVANSSLACTPRLPMQWGITGRPTWFAPRHIALGFTPVLASVVLALFLAFPSEFSEAQRRAPLFVALAFLLAHGLHLHLVRRHLSRGL